MRGWFMLDIRHGNRLSLHNNIREHVLTDSAPSDGYCREDLLGVLADLMFQEVCGGHLDDSAWAIVPLPVVFESDYDEIPY